MIGNLKFTYFEQPVEVKAMGTINVSGPRSISIEVWDKTAIPSVAKAIEDAQAGFSVSVVGNAILANLAALSNERREELVKLVKKVTEKFKIEVRSAREDAIKKLKGAEEEKKITEDDLEDAKKDVQKRVDAANSALEAELQKKITELSE
jgi:ribosome recycling factor